MLMQKSVRFLTFCFQLSTKLLLPTFKLARRDAKEIAKESVRKNKRERERKNEREKRAKFSVTCNTD